jgi:hypothetical protein
MQSGKMLEVFYSLAMLRMEADWMNSTMQRCMALLTFQNVGTRSIKRFRWALGMECFFYHA